MTKTDRQRSIAVHIIGVTTFAAAVVTLSLGLVLDKIWLIVVGISVGLLGGTLYFFSVNAGVSLRKAISFRASKGLRLLILIVGTLPWVIIAFIYFPLKIALLVLVSLMVGSVVGWLVFSNYPKESGPYEE